MISMLYLGKLDPPFCRGSFFFPPSFYLQQFQWLELLHPTYKKSIPFILFTTPGTLMDKPSATVQYMEICVSFWVISLSWVIYSPWHEANAKTQIVSEISGNIFKEFQIIKNIWLQKSNIYLQTQLSAKPINQNEDMMQENNKWLLHLIITK